MNQLMTVVFGIPFTSLPYNINMKKHVKRVINGSTFLIT
ncbi:hypothetical protein LM7414_140023 [Listeria monocytogenes]|nr:hypothetical protein LM7414_140023 [Listeria monocytogenes]